MKLSASKHLHFIIKIKAYCATMAPNLVRCRIRRRLASALGRQLKMTTCLCRRLHALGLPGSGASNFSGQLLKAQVSFSSAPFKLWSKTWGSASEIIAECSTSAFALTCWQLFLLILVVLKAMPGRGQEASQGRVRVQVLAPEEIEGDLSVMFCGKGKRP